MEPEVKDFLKRIVWSVFFGLLWLMLNMTLGIYFDLLFIHDKIDMGNIFFYVFVILSLSGLIWYYAKTWKKKFPHG
ncbi:MAG: hypothetical protein C5B59_10140 [Bacteroidetes bacterium]|nr:MAG: hypothetical protein C5B59_10140 [Bacteroidota bacterium]